jgi:hypothetical protein
MMKEMPTQPASLSAGASWRRRLAVTYKLICPRAGFGCVVDSGQVTSLSATRARVQGFVPSSDWLTPVAQGRVQIALRLDLPFSSPITLYGTVSEIRGSKDAQLLNVDLFPLTSRQHAALARYFTGTDRITRRQAA